MKSVSIVWQIFVCIFQYFTKKCQAVFYGIHLMDFGYLMLLSAIVHECDFRLWQSLSNTTLFVRLKIVSIMVHVSCLWVFSVCQSRYFVMYVAFSACQLRYLCHVCVFFLYFTKKCQAVFYGIHLMDFGYLMLLSAIVQFYMWRKPPSTSKKATDTTQVS
jgi:hypothetical protein